MTSSPSTGTPPFTGLPFTGPPFTDPPPDCPLCPRLASFRTANRTTYHDAKPAWHNAPVASFGGLESRLLVVGLAPGLKGANRTGRPFTGDYAGDLLYAGLEKFGFSQGTYDARPDDGLILTDCRITNAVRCVPPENKPTGSETTACRPFLESEIAAMPNLRMLMALGKVAHDAVIRTFGLKLKDHPFGHGAIHSVGEGLTLADSYHCSRYNTQTKRLTREMFFEVLAAIRARLS
ncbi:MAG: uracil-DNA glycosylase [Alphaproteobacteria bacterium]|nr:uracil-DNA glycosylase [Alphaproteobacteria bacterium]